MKAEEYLATRQKEVEADLMNLVMHVTKKVLPKGISYEAHKDLVVAALRDVKIEKKK
jgi:flagellar biosynthesis/type III secretory pathway protein FliH